VARARNIKPGLYKNEDLAECSIWARYLFPGLWMLADREGRLEDRPKRIKGELLPFDAQDVEPLLRELEARSFLIRYQIDGSRYIQISKFSQHQSPHYSEKPSAIKPPLLPEFESDIKDRDSEKCGCIKGGAQPPDSLIPDSLIPDSLNKPFPSTVVEGAPDGASSGPPDCPHERLIALYHELMLANPRVEEWNDTRRGLMRARWREKAAPRGRHPGYANVEDGIAFWRRFFAYCAESRFLTGQADPSPGRPPFVATLEWLIRPTNFAKVVEGNFHR
jgi:hypothetical protein